VFLVEELVVEVVVVVLVGVALLEPDEEVVEEVDVELELVVVPADDGGREVT
jgi:hypothetical protein